MNGSAKGSRCCEGLKDGLAKAASQRCGCMQGWNGKREVQDEQESRRKELPDCRVELGGKGRDSTFANGW